MTISPKKAVLITLIGWLVGLAVLAVTLPAGEVDPDKKRVMFWFVICFYGPLCFAIDFPAMALYFMINRSPSLYFSFFAILFPAAALVYSFVCDFNNFQKLLPSLIIFGPAVFLVIKLQKQAWQQSPRG